MLEQILAPVANWVMWLISTTGYWGVGLAMAIESCLIPLPSEIIMPFSGYLVSTGRFSILGITLAGGIGNLIGSIPPYILGYVGHEKVVRKFVRKYGKWILLSEHELDKTEKMFKNRGNIIVFFARLLPGIRTVISLPAGIARMPFVPFAVYTVVGSLIWSLFLGYIGVVLGENWDTLGGYFHKLDFLIIIIVFGAAIFYVWSKLRKKNEKEIKNKEI